LNNDRFLRLLQDLQLRGILGAKFFGFFLGIRFGFVAAGIGFLLPVRLLGFHVFRFLGITAFLRLLGPTGVRPF